MSIAEPLTVLKAELLQTLVPQVLDVLTRALHEGTAVHQVEGQLWDLALQLGRRSLAAFFDGLRHRRPGRDPHPARRPGSAAPGATAHAAATSRSSAPSGWSGPSTAAAKGKPWSSCRWTIACNCPQSVFSYVLQDWDQALAVEQAFGQVNQTIARMLKLKQSVDSLEGMNRQMAQDVGCVSRPARLAAGGRGRADRGGDGGLQGDRDPRPGDADGLRRRASGRAAGQPETHGHGRRPCTRWTPTCARRTTWWPPCSATRTTNRGRGRSRATSGSGPVCRRRAPSRRAASRWSSTGCGGSSRSAIRS